MVQVVCTVSGKMPAALRRRVERGLERATGVAAIPVEPSAPEPTLQIGDVEDVTARFERFIRQFAAAHLGECAKSGYVSSARHFLHWCVDVDGTVCLRPALMDNVIERYRRYVILKEGAFSHVASGRIVAVRWLYASFAPLEADEWRQQVMKVGPFREV